MLPCNKKVIKTIRKPEYHLLVYTRRKYCNLIGKPQVFIFISNLYGGYYGNAMLLRLLKLSHLEPYVSVI